jgi:tetratricopeptide (TPR) repeat protein
VKTKQLLMPTYFLALLYLSGCATFQVSSDFQAGRNALQTGRTADAVGYLTRAANVDPGYKTSYRFQAGVLAYLGRAYYESGKDADARARLEKAVGLDNTDALAHLYLGLTLLRGGDSARGRKEIEDGLKAINDTLEYIATDRATGIYWDPARQIRNDISNTLAAKSDAAALAMAAERIGRNIDEEIDKARRDEANSRSGGDSGGM